jgi:hypothetical protein
VYDQQLNLPQQFCDFHNGKMWGGGGHIPQAVKRKATLKHAVGFRSICSYSKFLKLVLNFESFLFSTSSLYKEETGGIQVRQFNCVFSGS